ncbi:tektin-2-like [Maniola hyperantus]|uniref:tektin-2-like n=1 Tax=Aphantopus hyperantus TaxID=2795564 RepID=UPI0015685F95|nr:myosin-1B-like [Maniola hyperantus]
MFCEDVCLGSTRGIDKLRALSDTLSAKAVDQVNGSQELVMLTGFARESNEYQFKKVMQDRISDVASWHWVLEDLSKRLDESINALKYEHNALRVVVKRVQEEMDCHSREGSRPGALCPLTDVVEEFVIEEFKFLRDQKKNFENLIEELDKQTATLEKTKKKIENDILNKQQALSVEEKCASKDYTDVIVGEWKRRKKGSPVARWSKRCASLKRSGLKALYNAVITRQQVRGARMRLSIAAQAYAAKVDAVLRRRLHTNKLKLQDLNWQREEAVRDYNSLQEELSVAEKTVIETMDQERVVAARLADRTQRPDRELTKDDVNRKLRDEQNQLRKFSKELRNNIEEIITLQKNITAAIGRIDCFAEDLIQVIGLDDERLRCRLGETSHSGNSTAYNTSSATVTTAPTRSHSTSGQLTIIQEENEDDDDDDYPFDF